MEISENQEKGKSVNNPHPLYPLQKSSVHCVHIMYRCTHFRWNRFKKRGLYTILKTYLSNQTPFFLCYANVLNMFKASEITGSGFNLYQSRHCAYMYTIQCENMAFKNSLCMYRQFRQYTMEPPTLLRDSAKKNGFCRTGPGFRTLRTGPQLIVPDYCITTPPQHCSHNNLSAE